MTSPRSRPPVSRSRSATSSARHQPFTPIIETARTLLAGTSTPASALLPALGWSLTIALGGYLWARHLYHHRIA